MPLETVSIMGESVCVKDEPHSEDSMHTTGVSEAAAKAGLYTNHEVKDKLVVGHEEVQKENKKIASIVCEGCCYGVCVRDLKSGGSLNFSDLDIELLVARGRWTPSLDLQQKRYKDRVRKFSRTQYDCYGWLTGCVHSNRLYCFPCLLFPNTNSRTIWNETGFFDINNFHCGTQRHAISEAHLEAALEFQKIKRNGLKKRLQSDIAELNAKVDRNRNVYRRLIDIVCFSMLQDIPFYCDVESASSVNSGRFFDMVDFLATYGGVLQNHLQSSSQLSKQTLNDLISSVASMLDATIKEQTAATDFVAVIVDETPAESGKKQLVMILRYFHESTVCDRFIKCIDISSNCSAESITAIILQTLLDFKCMDKVIAQTYNTSAISRTELIGVHSLVRQTCPSAVYVWCSMHPLNLVLFESCQSTPETKRFFNIVKTLCNFFYNNTKRQNHYNKMADLKKLPQVAETHWSYNSHTVNVIFDSHLLLIDAFEDMCKNEKFWDGETLCQVKYLLWNIKEFEFQFLLQVFNEVFTETGALHETIKENTADVAYCSKKLHEFKMFLKSLRSKFEEIYADVKKLVGIRKRKRDIDKSNDHFRTVFIETCTNIFDECHNRYQNLKELNYFQILFWKNCAEYRFSQHFAIQILNELVKSNRLWKTNVDHLTRELNTIYKNAEFKDMSIYNLIKYFYENRLISVFPEVVRFAKFIVTNPAYSDLTDGSFSSLKRIQTCLRTTKCQETELSKCLIEKSLLIEMKRSPNFYESILKIYAQKDGREDLMYKTS